MLLLLLLLLLTWRYLTWPSLSAYMARGKQNKLGELVIESLFKRGPTLSGVGGGGIEDIIYLMNITDKILFFESQHC